MTGVPLALPTLSGPRLVLREWRDSDVAVVQEASHDAFIPLATTVPTTDGEPEALAFIARQHLRLTSGAGYVFAIADPSDRAVGLIGLFFRHGAGARASVGYWIVASARRQGYAAEALTTLTEWAVQHDELDRIEVYVEPWNVGSWRAAESAGFAREGLLHAWERIDGTPRDMYMYARLTQNALAQRAR
jgi:ribosomal-protein-alanine N-acetyltransferase